MSYLREDIAKDARKDGAAACRDGAPIESNPHQEGTLACRYWDQGWRMAEARGQTCIS